MLSSSNNLVTRKFKKKETNFKFEDKKKKHSNTSKPTKRIKQDKGISTKPTRNIGTHRIVSQNNNRKLKVSNINKTTIHIPQLSLGSTSVFRIGRNLVRGGHTLIKASRRKWITKRYPLIYQIILESQALSKRYEKKGNYLQETHLTGMLGIRPREVLPQMSRFAGLRNSSTRSNFSRNRTKSQPTG